MVEKERQAALLNPDSLQFLWTSLHDEHTMNTLVKLGLQASGEKNKTEMKQIL